MTSLPMNERPEIKITFDQEAMTEQVKQAISEPMLDMAWRLRSAADLLDAGLFVDQQEKAFDQHYERGLSDGRGQIEPVLAAWRNPGLRPDVHEQAKARLRAEWPALYAALYAALEELEWTSRGSPKSEEADRG